MKQLLVRRMMIALLVVSMMLSSFSSALAADPIYITDVKGHWAESQLNKWMTQGLIQGYDDGKFKPDQAITRAEFMTLVNLSFALTDKAEINFIDVKASNWAYDEVAKAVKAGYITGYSDGSMGLSNKISRQETAVIINRLLALQVTDNQELLAFKDLADFADWSKASIGAVVGSKVMNGYEADQTFKPRQPITRAEAVVTLDRAMEKKGITTYNKAGTFGPETGVKTINHDVVVNTDGVTLQNMVIQGNLLLAEGIGSGDAFLKNVTVTGTTTINGGGQNSIHFENCILVTIIVDKKDGTVRIVAEGTTIVAEVLVKTPVIIEESDKTVDGFKAVTLSDELPADSKIIMIGSFDSLDVFGKKIVIEIPIGSVKLMNVAKDANGISFDIGKEATIVELILDAVLKVIGQGTIKEAIIGNLAAGSTFETQPQKKELKNEDAIPTPAPTPTPTPTPVDNSNSTPPLSSAKVITGTTVGDLVNGHIINVPAATKAATLRSALTVSASAAVEILASSGGSAVTNQSSTDVTAMMVIQVTAQDGTKAEYSITMAGVVLSSAKAITGTTIGTLSNGNIINVPAITKVAALKSALSISPSATVEILEATGSIAVTNQSSTNVTVLMVIQVTSQDGTKAEYSITVDAPVISNGTEITAFSFGSVDNAPATINSMNHSINIQVLNGTSLIALQPSFTLSAGAVVRVGGSIQTSGMTMNSYSNPITYTVTAEDGTTDQDWTVSVTEATIASLSATAEPGATEGYTQLTNVTAGQGNHLYVLPSAGVLPTPTVGDIAPNSNSSEIDNYTAGTQFPTSSLVKYVHIYEVDNLNKVVKFQLITLTASQIKSISVGQPAPIVVASASPGFNDGTTKIVASPFYSGTHIALKLSFTNVATLLVGADSPTGPNVIPNYVSGTEIFGMDDVTNKYIIVYELDANDKIVAYKLIKLVSNDIMPKPSFSILAATVSQGAVVGSTSVSTTLSNPLNHLVIFGSSTMISAPIAGDEQPLSSGVTLITPYTSGDDIPSMDLVVNKYLAIYEANEDGLIIQYKLFELVDGDINLPVVTIVSDIATIQEAFNNVGVLNGGTLSLTIANSTFLGAGQEDVTSKITVNNLPAGLTHTATFANTLKIYLDLTGAATSHGAINSQLITIIIDKSIINGALNDISVQVQINFVD